METTKVSSKGQVVLPKSVRDALDWPPGTNLSVEVKGHSVLLRPARTIRPTTIDEVAGSIKYDGPPITLEDMDRAVLEEARARWERKNR
ncbi:MAG: AbrB/MazE/SpoVT family DNA-binding domain-containing protein [Bauldia sp.]|nr:AbrB/MazE/SpoVT family DNA-binding domain-containing protein [Bauldia sp.]